MAVIDVTEAAAKRIRVLLENDGKIDTHRINAASPSGGALAKLSGLIQLGAGLLQARPLLARLAPAVVVGFGGYPSVPTVWAATQARIPTLLRAPQIKVMRLTAGVSPS